MFDGMAENRRTLAIGSFRLDLDGRRLLDRAGQSVPLRPKTFDVLRSLAERCGKVVTRDELLDIVWGDIHVTDDSVTQCIAEIRRALSPLGAAVIRTIPRRGYALNHPADAPCDARTPAIVSILPFVGLGSTAAELLSAAFAEDIAVELVRLGRVDVVRPREHTNAASARGMPQSISVACHNLRGTIRVGQYGKVRITAELSEVAQGSVRWADRFDYAAADAVFLNAHDQLVASIARAVCDTVQGLVRRESTCLGVGLAAEAQRSDSERLGVPL
jgi:DNA-binding winged helix-turn-helix (wHTH) protein